MREFWLLLLLTSCAPQRSPQSSDVFFDPDQQNWLKIYSNELKSARDNNDMDAWMFFWPEYLKELKKQNQKRVNKIK